MKALYRIHFLHGILLVIMLISGLLLFSSTTRTFFNQIGFPLVQFHIIIACMYIFIVLLSIGKAGRYLIKKSPIKRFNFLLHLTFFKLWSLTGAIMYFQAYVPSGLRNSSVTIHDWVTFLYVPWLITHMVSHSLNIPIPWPKWWHSNVALPPAVKENMFQRRDFLKLTGYTLFFISLGGLIKWLTPILNVAKSENRKKGYFRIYNVTNDYPRYTDKDWTLTIDGLVNKKTEITYYDLLRLPSTIIVDDFHCVTGWSVRNVEMKGVLLKDLLSAYEIEMTGDFITAYSGDNVYYDSFIRDQIVEEEAYLIYEFDGIPLNTVQGYPCRLYQPNMYGYKSVKWINRLEVTEQRKIGYWQQSGGYDLDGYL